MNFSLFPSLKHRTLIKITIELWNQNIKDLVARSSSHPNYTIQKSPKEWQVVEDKVIEKAQNLPLPELLKKEVLDLIQPIGLEILKWKDCHVYYFGRYLGTGLSTEFCWTPQGTVDEKKTAEIWLKDESVDITTRYELACIYCFEDDVKELWNSMPEWNKKDFNEKHQRFFEIPDTTMFFSYCIKGELSMLNDLFKQVIPSPYADAFQDSASKGNKVATEYFLQKLTSRERDECMVKNARLAAHIFGTLLNKFVFKTDTVNIDFPMRRECYADVLCFLLSQMNEEQQVKVFENMIMNEEQPIKLFDNAKDNAAEVLSCLLVWPWQRFFMETANRVWDMLSEKCYLLLLRTIADKIIDGYKDYNYRQLFGEFWQQSPSAYKEFVIGRCTSGDLLLEFFKTEDREIVRLILESATPKQRETILFSWSGRIVCVSLICDNNWELLKFFIQECMPSEDLITETKEKLRDIKRYMSKELTGGESNILAKFFQFLDDLYENSENRCVEEESSNPAKKLKFDS